MKDVAESQQRIWERARMARDPRFDGRFFIGVTSTGIYCRPICPAASPKAENVRYFASAAAAAEAGFRPCLRCRPEASPGTPAWAGTPASVTRALKLIGESALDDGSVDDLAQRLGMGSRHLRRLFLRHLGATPVAVAQTRRVHFAKKLIDETSLPMTRIAMSAGFGSVRRFNTAFRDLYGRPPRDLRRLAPASSRGEDRYTFRIEYRPPYDWQSIIAFLTPRATPGVESVTPDEYRRTIELNGQAGEIAIRPAARGNALTANIRFPDPAGLFRIIERIRGMFDVTADPAAIASVLGKDATLRSLVKRRPGLRVPGCWDPFELAVRAILGQQVSVKAATTLAGRFVTAFGKKTEYGSIFPCAATTSSADLRNIGLTGARIRTIHELATRAAKGMPIEEAVAGVPGIGPWTRQYIAMRLGEPDAFPATDLHLAAHAKQSAQWSPWRAYAALYLWSNV
jgi:AraC family transcriptional regulator of adaptative response / DNA-3-methyladenine glycosylase II